MLRRMMIRLCQAGLNRIGSEGQRLLSTLRERGLTPVTQGCLDRCRVCEQQVIAVADGLPLAAPNVDALLEQITELADEDEL